MAEEQRWYYKYRKELLMAFAALAVLILIIGLALSWFFGRLSASTVGRVKAPAEISILGPNETYMEQIDLSYDKTEVKNGTVTLERPFCVSSPSNEFDLYLAHTTNIEGFTIELHKAEAVASSSTGDNILKGIDSNGVSYTWSVGENIFITDKASDISKDGYLNKQDIENDILADRSLHEMTFGTYGSEKVQDNAEPLYWHYKAKAPIHNANEGTYTGNFVLKLSWQEKFKETDIIYLIAKSR